MIDPNTVLACAYSYDPECCGVKDCISRDWCEKRRKKKAVESTMTGIYINGLEMPDACDECACGILHDGYSIPFCAITSEDMCRNDFHTKRRDDCPLVPVPPHGRLIDADELCDGLVSNHPVVIHANAAPTIIPASEESVKTEEDSEPWLCLSCRYYPPSSTDGKPCSQCNPSDVWHSCYDPAEEGENAD